MNSFENISTLILLHAVIASLYNGMKLGEDVTFNGAGVFKNFLWLGNKPMVEAFYSGKSAVGSDLYLSKVKNEF